MPLCGIYFLMFKKGVYMGEKNSLYKLTWPIFIEILLYMLMGNADTLMLSQYSDDAVAAVGVSNQIISVTVVMFGFIATGSAILIAQYLGANNIKDAKEVSIVAIYVNLLFGLLISLILFVFSDSILSAMNLSPELLDYGNDYLGIVGGFLFLQALIMTIGAILRSYGFTKDTMYITIGMNLLNIIGNYLFIFGPFGIPVLGVFGVAISTTTSRAIGLFVLIIIFIRRTNGQFTFNFTFPKKHLTDILKIGIPSAGEHLSYNTSQMVITYFITQLGKDAITTKVYTQNLMMFIYLFSAAVGQGTQIIVGYLVGAGKFNDAYHRCLRSLKFAIVVSFGIAVLFSIFSESLFGIFTDNEEIIALGSTLIMLTILLEPGRSFNLVIISSLRASGDVKFPVYMGIISMWGISVTLSYLLGLTFEMGLVGIWIAYIVDEWFRGLIMLRRWKSRIWESKAFVK